LLSELGFESALPASLSAGVGVAGVGPLACPDGGFPEGSFLDPAISLIVLGLSSMVVTQTTAKVSIKNRCCDRCPFLPQLP